VEVRAGDVPDGVDHRHDHEPERDRNAHVSERVRLRVDHHRAGSGEDEREGADRLGRCGAEQRHYAGLTALMIAPCMPSATSCVNSTEMSAKPAASSPASYS